MKDLIKLNNVSYSYPRLNVFGKDDKNFKLDDVSLEVPAGKVMAFVGESGSGKTTLAKLICGLITPESGEISYNFSLESRVSPIQILFQNSVELINPSRRVKDILRYPSSDDKTIEEMLELLRLNNSVIERMGGDLSGGERQRIALARLLTVKPKVLILDEPFSAQDVQSQYNILNILKDVKTRYNFSLLVVSHGISILKNFANKIAVLYEGKIVENSTAEILFEKPLHPYTKFLLEASKYELTKSELPKANRKEESFECNYYNRCPIKVDKCKTDVEVNVIGENKVFCNKPEEINV